MAIFGVINTADGGDTFYEGMVKAKDNFATLETEITDARDGKASTHAAIAEKVTGPSTNTADYVPQWNGTNSKALKNGFAVTAAGKALLDDADADAQLTTLGVTAAGKAIVSVESMDAMVSSLASSGLVMKKGTDITVTVGAAGDYTTINDALAALSAYYPLYVSGGFTAEISLLSGFVMAEQVLVSGIDLSWITITAVDASTTITRSALTVSFGGTYPAFGVIRGHLPVIGALFSMDTSGTATGRNFITARDGSFVKVSASCGCQYAGANGIALYDASSGMLTGADFSHATGVGIYANGACVVQANSTIVSYAGTYGVSSTYASSVNAANANGGNASSYGFQVASGGNISASGVTGTLSQAANTLTASGIIYQ